MKSQACTGRAVIDWGHHASSLPRNVLSQPRTWTYRQRRWLRQTLTLTHMYGDPEMITEQDYSRKINVLFLRKILQTLCLIYAMNSYVTSGKSLILLSLKGKYITSEEHLLWGKKPNKVLIYVAVYHLIWHQKLQYRNCQSDSWCLRLLPNWQ